MSVPVSQPRAGMDPMTKWVMGIVGAVVAFSATQGLRGLLSHLNAMDIQSAKVVTKLDAVVEAVQEIREDSKHENATISSALSAIERSLIEDKAMLLAKITAVERRVDAIDQWIIRNNNNHSAMQSEVRDLSRELAAYRATLDHGSEPPPGSSE